MYSRTAGGLVKSRCLVYENKIFVVGNYEKHECAITVANVEKYEQGEWQCEVREYITRYLLFHVHDVYQFIKVQPPVASPLDFYWQTFQRRDIKRSGVQNAEGQK